jgi:hypothetical protein
MPDGKYLIGESLREKLKSTIAKVESIPFGGPVSRIPTALEDGSSSFSPKVFRVCTVNGEWPVDTSKAVKFYGVTSEPNTVSVLNKIVTLPAPKGTTTSRIVNVAKDGTQWYLVSFQMSSKTAVMATATQTITFIGTAATQTMTVMDAAATETITFVGGGGTQEISYAAPGADVTVITDIVATLNTSDCSISVVKTTTTIRTAGNTQKLTTVSAGSTQTATVITMSGTQTVTIMSASGTQTATITTGTHTATYISLEI